LPYRLGPPDLKWRLPNNKESMSLFPNSMEIDVKLVSKKAYDYWLEIKRGPNKPLLGY